MDSNDKALSNENKVEVPALVRGLPMGEVTSWGRLTRNAMKGDTVVYVEKEAIANGNSKS